LDELRADARFAGDPRWRAEALAEVRALIASHPVDAMLLGEVEAYVDEHFGAAPVRFRSSSNTEDLPGFSGAGLYSSVTAYLDDPTDSIEDAIRAVWASLYLARGWDERDYFNIAQDQVAMAVLVHPAFPGERANGVGISRNVLEPIRDQHYFNVQHGEALVTNPAPGVGTEQIIHDRRRTPRVRYLARSTLRERGAGAGRG
jgi:phosphoenolpyruvate synthase/pyruvate phosphate dikinase